MFGRNMRRLGLAGLALLAPVALAAGQQQSAAPASGDASPSGIRLAAPAAYLDDRPLRQDLARQVRQAATQQLAAASDPAARRGLLAAARAAALTLEQWQEAVDLTRQIRALEPKPAQQQLEGLVLEAIASAHLRPSPSPEGFATELSQAAARLDGAVVAQSLRSFRSRYYLTSANSVRAQIEGRLSAIIAARRGVGDVGLAGDLLEQLFVLESVVPQLAAVESVLARRLAAQDMQIADRWSPRQIALDGNASLAPVIVGVWDSGVDPRVFGDRLWRNPGETENGLDDDGNGFVDDIYGFAFDPDRRPTTGALGELPGGSQEAVDRLARYSTGVGDLNAGEMTEQARFARSVSEGLAPAERAAFELDLQRFGLFTHGTGVASIAIEGNPAARIMMGRMSYRIGPGQPVPVVDEADAAARIAYANRAIAYFRERGVRIVNMSFRLSLPNVENSLAALEPDPVRRRARAERIYNSLHEGFEQAIHASPDILFVTGPGNSNENNDEVRSFPAGIDAENLLTVGGIDSRLEPADITGFGRSVHLYALGVSVPQRLVGGGMVRYTGVSSATPQVSNLAAKLLALCPSLSVRDLRRIIVDTATLEGAQRLRVVHPRAAVQRLQARGC